MLSLNLYIQAAAAIAPEAAGGEEVLRLNAREPDYTGVIPPMQLRRTSKAVRMGISTAHRCLKQSGIEKPGAIVTGTSLGCIADTEVFLRKLVEQEEQMLTPTAFIQSTHNTVAGQIALATGCHGYNNTVVQHGHSFEGAMVSSALFLAEHPEEYVLCGGVDELTETVHGLFQRVSIYSATPYAPDDTSSIHNGAIAGEGAGFFLISTKAQGAKARICGVDLFSEYNTRASERIQSTIDSANGLRNTDFLLIGAYGDSRSESSYPQLLEHGIRYRHTSGAWGTDIAPAMARLVNNWPAGKERAWIVTHWGHDWSVWLLELV